MELHTPNTDRHSVLCRKETVMRYLALIAALAIGASKLVNALASEIGSVQLEMAAKTAINVDINQCNLYEFGIAEKFREQDNPLCK